MFEEHSSSFSSPYLFNGKELDRETNLSYYGARYYDAKVSLWLSVDPLAEKFYMNSPYIYVSQKPLNLIDPTGMSEESADDWIKNGTTIVYDKTITTQEGATEAFGKNAQLLKDGAIIENIKLNNNGTATDENSNQIDLKNDIMTSSGILIKSPKDRSGSFSGFSYGFALGGGLSFELGIIRDPSGNRGVYFSFGGNTGLGSLTGGKSGEATPTGDNLFSIFDFGGKGNSYSAGVDTPFGGLGVERGGSQGGNGFFSYGMNDRGYKFTSASKNYSISPKFKVGGVISETKTWVFPF